MLKASPKLFGDETTVPVLDLGRGRTKTGQLFAYARDDRPWGGADPPAVAYVYAPDQKGERPIAHLDRFAGILQVDGGACPWARQRQDPRGGYKTLAGRNAVSLAFCWAHVRRRFYELAPTGPAPIASEALLRIADLYRVEADIRGRTPEERRDARQQRSKPIIDALEPWLRQKLALISRRPSSPRRSATRSRAGRGLASSSMTSASSSQRNAWHCRDNNIVERSIRPLALTRKNALFAGSDGGAEHWAVIASLVETAKLNGIDPQAYLTDIITRILEGHPNSRIDELMPWAYPANPTLSDVA